MNWEKKGLIISPEKEYWWSQTHAFLPTADILKDDIVRVYFASRDKNLISRIGYVEFNAKNPKKILYRTHEPILETGGFGTFDEFGVNPCCIINKGNEKLLYYFGWQKSINRTYSLFCGLAISNDDGRTFQRYSRAPILDRTNNEPFLRSTVSVLEDNGIYRMWYSSGKGWTEFNNKPCPIYNIRYSESKDGYLWEHHNRVCIDSESDDEFGFARPWVIKDGSIYKMWYSLRSKSKPYTIGYAESSDGLNWTRKDSIVGIQRSSEGWDSEMICFACIYDSNGKKYMLYNGNKHGTEGFGYAKLSQ
jgi:predicted GH43/DUF377 family glycosyl hydrolase